MTTEEDGGGIPLLHPGTRAGAGEARRRAGPLGAALGVPVRPRPFGPGEREAARAGGVPGAWALLDGADLLAGAPSPAGRAVLLPRRDPRWSLEDLLHRPPDRLPPRTRVVAGSALGAALLRRVRPDLVAVAAGAFPLPEETPVLAEGPFEDLPAGIPLDPSVFVPAPGTGLGALAAPEGVDVPPAVRALEDPESATALLIERAFVEGLGLLPPGTTVGALARRKVSVLFSLRAVLFLPGGEPRDLLAEIPLADARQFARGFGRHLAP